MRLAAYESDPATPNTLRVDRPQAFRLRRKLEAIVEGSCGRCDRKTEPRHLPSFSIRP